MLNQEIRNVIQQFRRELPPELSALLEQGAGEISALDIVERAKKVGDKAPPFELTNQRGDVRRLEGYLASGPLVVTFYRGVWCPFCNLQLKTYADHLGEITSRGASLVAVSPEQPDAIDILRKSEAPKDVIDMAYTNAPFDVLYDKNSELSKEFGLVFELPESHKKLMVSLNVDIEALTGNSFYAFPDPATYVINREGIIKWAFVPNNYRKRAEVTEILGALDMLK